jgi:hypothetical protein
MIHNMEVVSEAATELCARRRRLPDTAAEVHASTVSARTRPMRLQSNDLEGRSVLYNPAYSFSIHWIVEA